MEVPDEALAWAAELALEMRRRVKEQQAFIGAAEFGKVDLSYRIGDGPEKIVYCERVVRHRLAHGERSRRRRRGTADGQQPGRCRFPTQRTCHRQTPGTATTPPATTIDGRFEVRRAPWSGRFLAGVSGLRRGRGRGACAASCSTTPPAMTPYAARSVRLRKVHHPNVVKVFWADKTSDGRVVPDIRVHRGRVARRVRHRAGGTCATGRRSTSPSTCSTRSSRSTRTPSASSELEEKRQNGELTQDEYDEMHGAAGARTRPSRHQAAATSC